jgi:hypothetical integral membrane protein (TIGR02206 family)
MQRVGRFVGEPLISRIVGGMILLLLTADLAVRWRDGRGFGALPMQLCDWAMFASALALIVRSQLAFEVTYFWGLSGTLQSILTPGFAFAAEWWRVAGFFLNHVVIVATCVYCILERKERISWKSLLRVLAITQIYFVLALLVNHWGDQNFGFLTEKPRTVTLLSYLADGPWLYRLQIQGLALIFFLALYFPWALAGLLKRKKEPLPS